MYIVTRDGHRVSNLEYKTKDDPEAIAEFKFWKSVSEKKSCNEKVEIVQYDREKHEIY